MFCHGLGDAVQFTAVLRYLVLKGCEVHLWCKRAVMPVLRPWCMSIHAIEDGVPASLENISFSEPTSIVASHASTKIEMHLASHEKVALGREDCGYAIRTGARAVASAEKMLRDIGHFVLVHHTGESSRGSKAISVTDMRPAIESIHRSGRQVVLVDVDGVSGMRSFCDVVLDEGFVRLSDSPLVLAEIAKRADLCLGIDSGPGKIFQAADAQTIIVWRAQLAPGRRLHPFFFDEPRETCLHLVPQGHLDYVPGLSAQAFSHYRHAEYPVAGLSEAIDRHVCDALRLCCVHHPDARRCRVMMHYMRPGREHEDAKSISRVWVSDVYGLRSVRSIFTVLDIRAGIGEFSTFASWLWPGCDQIAVEDRAEYIQAALSNLDGTRVDLRAGVQEAGCGFIDLVRVGDGGLRYLASIDKLRIGMVVGDFGGADDLDWLAREFRYWELKKLWQHSSGYGTFKLERKK